MVNRVMVSWYGSSQLVVVQTHGLQSAVAHTNVGRGQGPCEPIMGQVQVSQGNKIFTQIHWQCTCELVATQIQEKQ
jgi:hypothetical protein